LKPRVKLLIGIGKINSESYPIGLQKQYGKWVLMLTKNTEKEIQTADSLIQNYNALTT
jgi:hypothetical protein